MTQFVFKSLPGANTCIQTVAIQVVEERELKPEIGDQVYFLCVGEVESLLDEEAVIAGMALVRVVEVVRTAPALAEGDPGPIAHSRT